MPTHLALGTAGEDAALERYRADGYDLIARNWRCRLGELDLIFLHHDTVVICEVKTRRGSAFGGGYEAVGPAKREKIRAVTQIFLAQTRLLDRPVRFDVASVSFARGASVEVFEDAF